MGWIWMVLEMTGRTDKEDMNAYLRAMTHRLTIQFKVSFAKHITMTGVFEGLNVGFALPFMIFNHKWGVDKLPDWNIYGKSNREAERSGQLPFSYMKIQYVCSHCEEQWMEYDDWKAVKHILELEGLWK